MVKREQFSINGKMVLITGASGGLGEQLAYECAKQQAGLILVARREEVLKQVANNCKQWTNQPVYYYACDLSKEEIEEMLQLNL